MPSMNGWYVTAMSLRPAFFHFAVHVVATLRRRWLKMWTFLSSWVVRG